MALYRTDGLLPLLVRTLQKKHALTQIPYLKRTARTKRLTNVQTLLLHSVDDIFSLYDRYLVVYAAVHNVSRHIRMGCFAILDCWSDTEGSWVDASAIQQQVLEDTSAVRLVSILLMVTQSVHLLLNHIVVEDSTRAIM